MHIHELFSRLHLSGLAAHMWAVVLILPFLVVHLVTLVSDHVPVVQALWVAVLERGNKASTAKRAV